MKKSRRLLLALLILTCLITELVPMAGFAATRYYTIRFYGGNVGTVSGTPAVTAEANTNVALPSVTPKEGYYFKGFIESGKDQKAFISPGGVVATKDVDYIAVYGIDGTQVKYTVQYLLNGTTTKLHADGTFYAGVGDRPISSYIYIEGYQPYRRSTKTLVADESQNVLICYYTAIPTGGGTTTTTTAAAAGAGAGAANANVNNAAGTNAAANAAGANAANPAGVNAAGANTVNPGANTPPAQQYQQTEDILDLDVPLAEPDLGGGSAGTALIPTVPQVIEPGTNDMRLPSWALIGGAVVLMGLIATLYWYLLFYRKSKKYANFDIEGIDGK